MIAGKKVAEKDYVVALIILDSYVKFFLQKFPKLFNYIV